MKTLHKIKFVESVELSDETQTQPQHSLVTYRVLRATDEYKRVYKKFGNKYPVVWGQIEDLLKIHIKVKTGLDFCEFTLQGDLISMIFGKNIAMFFLKGYELCTIESDMDLYRRYCTANCPRLQLFNLDSAAAFPRKRKPIELSSTTSIVSVSYSDLCSANKLYKKVFYEPYNSWKDIDKENFCYTKVVVDPENGKFVLVPLLIEIEEHYYPIPFFAMDIFLKDNKNLCYEAVRNGAVYNNLTLEDLIEPQKENKIFNNLIENELSNV